MAYGSPGKATRPAHPSITIQAESSDKGTEDESQTNDHHPGDRSSLNIDWTQRARGRSIFGDTTDVAPSQEDKTAAESAK